MVVRHIRSLRNRIGRGQFLWFHMQTAVEHEVSSISTSRSQYLDLNIRPDRACGFHKPSAVVRINEHSTDEIRNREQCLMLPLRPTGSECFQKSAGTQNRRNTVQIGKNGGKENGGTVDSNMGNKKDRSFDAPALSNLGGDGRIRTGDKGFADPCLTTWRRRPNTNWKSELIEFLKKTAVSVHTVYREIILAIARCNVKFSPHD